MSLPAAVQRDYVSTRATRMTDDAASNGQSQSDLSAVSALALQRPDGLATCRVLANSAMLTDGPSRRAAPATPLRRRS